MRGIVKTLIVHKALPVKIIPGMGSPQSFSAGRFRKCLSSLLLLICLTGCALDPMIRDPFADFDTGRQDPALKQLSVGLILSDNTIQTLKFAADTNASFTVALEGHPAIPDLNQKIMDYKAFLKKIFKSAVLIDRNNDVPTAPVDVLAVLDMHFEEFGLSAFENVVFSMKTIFMTPSRQPVAEVNGRGASSNFGIIPGSKWLKYIEGAIARAAGEMGQELLSSPALLEYAKTNTAGDGSFAQISSVPAIVAAVTSDVDELPTSKAKSNKSAYAIVIGIENYRQTLPSADFATHDAQTVSKYLTGTLGYPEENVIILLNNRALKSDLAKYFEKWLGNNVEADSTVFIYYAGHGAPDIKSGSAYLVPYDGDPAFIDQTGYSLSRMYEALGKLPAQKIIVALDAGFSGAGGRSVIAKGARPLVMNTKAVSLPKNMTVLSAAGGDQTSSTYDEKGHGLFTYFLLKGIKHEDVTRPDGSLMIDDLYGYIKPQVERVARKLYNNEQMPQLIESNKKDMDHNE